MMIYFRNTFSTEAFITIIILCFVFTIGPPPVMRLTLVNTLATDTMPILTTTGSLHCRPGGVAAREVVGVAE